jgi:hypothetical protein
MPRVVALIFPVLLAACAAAPRPESRPESQRCEAASARVEYLLHAGLESYLDGMRRYAGARDPELSTEAAEERTKARSDAWVRAHRDGIVRSCDEWSEDRYQCVMTAANAAALKHCGLEEVVRSYTDEVLSDHAARPFDRPGAPGR